MESKKIIISVLSFIFVFTMINLASAGLSTTNYISVNKTFEQSKTVNFTLTNDESFSFYNVSFEDNDYVTFPMIDEIASGESYDIQAEITTDEPFSGNLVIKGVYESSLGKNYETHNLTITFPDGVDECNFNIVEGDSVKWKNNVYDDIEFIGSYLILGDNIIQEGQSETQQFNNPEEFVYYLRRGGLAFGNTCTINVMDDFGYVHNPDYDAEIFFDIGILYPETSMSYNFPETNYSLEVAEEGEGIFSITNTGTKIAKNIHVSGEWFSFSANDFDLDVGKTKGILYIVKPIVSSTDDTNKTHTKTIYVEGNFPTIEQDMNIFVEYAEVVDGNNVTTGKSFEEWLIEACEADPSQEFCKGSTQIIINNGTDAQFNVTFGKDMVYGMFQSMYEKFDDEEEFRNWMKEWINGAEADDNSTQQDIDDLKNEAKETKENIQFLSDSFICFMIFISTGIICGGIWIYGRFKKKQSKFLSNFAARSGR